MTNVRIAIWKVGLLLCLLSGQVFSMPETETQSPDSAVTADVKAQITSIRALEEHPDQVLERTAHLLRTPLSSAFEAEILLLRSAAFERKGSYHQAIDQAERARAIALDEKSDVLLGSADYHLGYALFRLAEYSKAMAKAESARRLQEPAGASVPLIRTLALMGSIQQSLSDYGTALETAMRALALAEQLGHELSIARLHNNIGLIYWDLERSEQALISLNKALEILRPLEGQRDLANTLLNIGLMLIEQNRPEEALPLLDQVLEIDRQAGDRYGEAKVFSNLGYAYEKMNQPTEAFRYHEQALALREEIGDKDGIVRTQSVMADLWLLQGDPVKAINVLEQALAMAVEINERRSEAAILESLSKARAANGDFSGALNALRRFHELETEIIGSATARRVALLENRHAAEQQERKLAAMESLAQARREGLGWMIGGSVVLALSLLLLALLYFLRVKSQQALAESEQRYRSVFQHTSIPTLLIDQQSRTIVELNSAAQALGANGSSMDGCRLDQLEPESLRQLLGQIQECTAPFTYDGEWVDENGQPRWAMVRASTLSLDQRMCLLVSIQDTTDAHLAEASRELENRMESLGTFAGGIAHDFNNILTSIVGNVSLARELNEPARSEVLQRAEHSAMDATGLTSQLLTFAKGGGPVRELVDMKQVLQQAVALVNAGSSLKVELETPSDLWNAELDRRQFNQVVANLVLNAQQATGDDGELKIVASNFYGAVNGTAQEYASSDGVAQSFIRIDFTDNGRVGIPAEIQHRIFDPYFTTKSHHSGLGLATAYSICTKHNGGLTFQSLEGSGTTFSVFFPATRRTVSPVDQKPALEPSGDGRILLLDDDPQVRDIITRMLEQWGYRVDAVESGELAIQTYLQQMDIGQPYDLLFLDLTIPGGLGGKDVLAQILKRDPGARAVVISGYSDDLTMARYREVGFVGALNKPFRRKELALLLITLLQGDN